jgi:hypothetical protein
MMLRSRDELRSLTGAPIEVEREIDTELRRRPIKDVSLVGPIPFAELAPVMRMPGKTLALWLLILHRVEFSKSMWFTLTGDVLKQWGVHPRRQDRCPEALGAGREDCRQVGERRPSRGAASFARTLADRRMSARAVVFCRWRRFAMEWTGRRRRRLAAWIARRCATGSSLQRFGAGGPHRQPDGRSQATPVGGTVGSVCEDR